MGKKVFQRRIRLTCSTLLAGGLLIGCGPSLSEDEMVMRELRLSKEEISALSKELEESKKENETLARRISQLQEQLDTLQEFQQKLESVRGSNQAPNDPTRPNRSHP